DVERTPDNGSGKAPRRNSDDLERYAVDGQRLADDVRGAAEMPLPEVIANHYHWPVRPPTANVVRISERATERRGDTQGFEEGSAGPESVDDLCFAPCGEIEIGFRICEPTIELIEVVAQSLPHRIRPRLGKAKPNRLACGGHHHEALGVPNGKPAKKQPIDEREDCGI